MVTGSFADRLRAGPPVVADGGMGVVLSAAVPGLRCPEEANLRAPDAVVAVHVSFINAGAELIETNTFGANRHKLAEHFLEDEFERINSAGVKLAREAREITGREVFIGGSIGPGGEPGDGTAFAEQAQILEGRGADVLHARDVLQPARAGARGRGGSLRLAPADRRPDELRQRRGDDGGRLGAGRRRAPPRSSTSPPSARTTAAGLPQH